MSKSAVQTGSISLYTNFNYSNSPPTPVSVQASVFLTVTITGIDTDSNILSNVISGIASNVSGVSSIYGITYSQSNPNLGLNVARASAFSQAQSKATQYAKLAKRKLGSILSVEDSAPFYYYGLSQTSSTAAMGVHAASSSN